ncbi:hypothetical protein ACLOJK_029705 [Asimina triloba]
MLAMDIMMGRGAVRGWAAYAMGHDQRLGSSVCVRASSIRTRWLEAASVVGQHGQTIFAVRWVRSRQFQDRLDLAGMMDGMDLLVRRLLVTKMMIDGFGKMNG